MNPLVVLKCLRSAGLAFGAVPRLLGPSPAQRMAATASAAVGRVHKASATAARFSLQAACFSSGSWLQTEHTSKSAEAKDQAVQQLMVELLPQLEPLGMTPQLLRKVVTCNNRGSAMKSSTAHQLKDRWCCCCIARQYSEHCLPADHVPQFGNFCNGATWQGRLALDKVLGNQTAPQWIKPLAPSPTARCPTPRSGPDPVTGFSGSS